MALVTTSVTPEVRLSPFTGLSTIRRERSGIARAEEIHSAFGTWDAAGAGNYRGLIFTWDLDPAYGYVLMDCSAAFILSADHLKMEANGFLEITTNTGPGAAQIERQYYGMQAYPSRQNAAANTAIGSIPAFEYNSQYPSGTDTSTMIFNMPVKPTALLYPFPGVNDISCSVVFGEHFANDASMGYRLYCRFLQYDVTQGYNYVVQSPALTR